MFGLGVSVYNTSKSSKMNETESYDIHDNTTFVSQDLNNVFLNPHLHNNTQVGLIKTYLLYPHLHNNSQVGLIKTYLLGLTSYPHSIYTYLICSPPHQITVKSSPYLSVHYFVIILMLQLYKNILFIWITL